MSIKMIVREVGEHGDVRRPARGKARFEGARSDLQRERPHAELPRTLHGPQERSHAAIVGELLIAYHMPKVVTRAAGSPAAATMLAIMLVVLVLPLVPVTASVVMPAASAASSVCEGFPVMRAGGRSCRVYDVFGGLSDVLLA